MRAGDLCVLGGRTVFKIGYVVGPSRKAGKTRVRSFSASAHSFSEIFVISDELLSKLPPLRERTPNQRRTINLATVASAAARRNLRDLRSQPPPRQYTGSLLDRALGAEPACVASMGCLCAGHAAGMSVDEECDTDEERARSIAAGEE